MNVSLNNPYLFLKNLLNWSMNKKLLISDELAAFLESGLSINLATRDDDLQPDGAPAWAATVHEDRSYMTVFVLETSARAMMKNLKRHPEIAVVFDQPSTHRACQVKGQLTASRKARATERDEVMRQKECFLVDLEHIGIPRAMTTQLVDWPCMALELRVEQVFEQTPGPGAGAPLT